MVMPERLPSSPEGSASAASVGRVVAAPVAASAEFTAGAKRRSFTAKYKLQILSKCLTRKEGEWYQPVVLDASAHGLFWGFAKNLPEICDVDRYHPGVERKRPHNVRIPREGGQLV